MAEIPTFAQFYMVCRKPTHAGAKTEPRQRYSNKADARRTAAMLARDNNHPFVVLESIEIIRPGDPVDQEALL